jgi:hypothetical protein
MSKVQKFIAMKKMLNLFFTTLVILLAGCNQDKEATGPSAVSLKFQGQFGEAPLLMYERAYPYESGMMTKFQLFNFYISEVTLLPENPGAGEGTEIMDVGIVSFKDIQNEAAADAGVQLMADDVPPGRYGGIRFGIGVSEKLNQTQPGDYTPGHPLTDNYWSWAMGYVFFKIEGNADLDGDGQFEQKLSFHIGTNEFYRTKAFERPLEVKSGELLELTFNVDLQQVLAPNGDDFVDFHTITQDHTNDLELAGFLADNLAAAVRMK